MSYILDNSTPQTEAALLAELERETHRRTVHPQMLSGPEQGRFLELLCRMLQPRRVLEIGTFTGYSALSMAAGMPSDGILDTIEADDELGLLAGEFFARSRFGSRIRPHFGSALNVPLNGPYDLVFVDGDKREYPAYYERAMELVHPGSVLLFDNTLWYGKAEDPAAHDPHTLGVRAFNATAAADPRVRSVILPLRDGLSMLTVL